MRNPEDILKVLEEQALEDDIREVAASSDAELDEELRAAGVDPKEAHAAGCELAARAVEGGPVFARPPLVKDSK